MSIIVDDNTLFGLPPELSRAAHVLLRSGLLSTAAGTLNYDPYPKPGVVGTTSSDGKAGIIGPQGVLESGFKYPRVQADC